MNTTQMALSNFWFTQWCASLCARPKPTAEGVCWVDGLVVLIGIALLFVMLIWMWWASRPVDLVQEYKKRNTKNPEATTEGKESLGRPSGSGALGIVGTALIISNIFASSSAKESRVKK